MALARLRGDGRMVRPVEDIPIMPRTIGLLGFKIEACCREAALTEILRIAVHELSKHDPKAADSAYRAMGQAQRVSVTCRYAEKGD